MTYFNYVRLWTEISKDFPSELDDYIFSPYQKINFLMNIRLINNAMSYTGFLQNLQRRLLMNSLQNSNVFSIKLILSLLRYAVLFYFLSFLAIQEVFCIKEKEKNLLELPSLPVLSLYSHFTSFPNCHFLFFVLH